MRKTFAWKLAMVKGPGLNESACRCNFIVYLTFILSDMCQLRIFHSSNGITMPPFGQAAVLISQPDAVFLSIAEEKIIRISMQCRPGPHYPIMDLSAQIAAEGHIFLCNHRLRSRSQSQEPTDVRRITCQRLPLAESKAI